MKIFEILNYQKVEFSKSQPVNTNSWSDFYCMKKNILHTSLISGLTLILIFICDLETLLGTAFQFWYFEMLFYES